MQTISNIQTYPRRPSGTAEYKYSMNAIQLSDWKRSMGASLRATSEWKKFNSIIEEIAATYNRHFQSKNFCDASFFVAPNINPNLIRAIVYTETGPGAPRAWNTRPMQIGNTGDTGINDVLSSDPFTGENMKLILPESYRYINYEKIRSTPKENIIAGAAYLLLRACTFATITLKDESQSLEFLVTREHPNFEKISKKAGTTTDVLRSLNPGVNPNALKLGQKLIYQKARKQRVIYSIEKLDYSFVSSIYNVSGDASYKDKLEFFYSAIQEGF